MLKLTLRQMEYVAAVAEAGSLSAAAQNLHVSQPALSVAISQVEAQIGLTLFIRRKGARIIPTRHAAPFVTQIRSLLETAARAARCASTSRIRACAGPQRNGGWSSDAFMTSRRVGWPRSCASFDPIAPI